MEFQNNIKTLADRVELLKHKLETEEATKNAFIMPFIQLLGYDVFNPMEVVPEFTADLGIKKGEKVDYAIMQNNQPSMIIECKHWQKDLNAHSSQLHRYFHTTKARFGILTNGVQYRFYTDLEEQNKMDEEPFLEFDFENIRENTINELRKFHKIAFDVNKIIDSASELKYSTAIKAILESELQEPSEEFVRFFAKQIYQGSLRTKVLEQFKDIVKKSTNQAIKDIVNERLHSAIKKEEESNHVEEEQIEESKIITTEEEIEAFHIVKSILRTKVQLERISSRDTQSYFGVLLDDNNRKPICRFHFNGTNKYLGIFDMERKETKVLLNNIDEIYLYSDQIIAAALMYE